MSEHASNDRDDAEEPLRGDPSTANAMSPLPGEPGIPDVAQRERPPLSRKGLLAVVSMLLCVVAVLATSTQRLVASSRKPDADGTKLGRERPSAAVAPPRRLDMPPLPASTASSASSPRIPAIVPVEGDDVPPIGVHRTGEASSGSSATRSLKPEDAPVMVVAVHTAAASSGSASEDSNEPGRGAEEGAGGVTRNLQQYQQRLQGLMDTLTKSTALATRAQGSEADGMRFGSTTSKGSATTRERGASPLDQSSTPPSGSASRRVDAEMLTTRSLTLPKGTSFTCALKTKVVSATSGLIGCQVQRNVFSDDGRVLLIERGSHLDGEYQAASIRPGTVRIPVVWTRVRTPQGVVVDIDSPGTGQLGESGIDGYVDNRWGERLGAAMLLSLIDDSVQMVIQGQSDGTQAATVVLPSTTSNSSKLAEKVLDNTINIPPLVYRNQGGIVGIYVTRDVDFSGVYELKPTLLPAAGSAPEERRP